MNQVKLGEEADRPSMQLRDNLDSYRYYAISTWKMQYSYDYEMKRNLEYTTTNEWNEQLIISD